MFSHYLLVPLSSSDKTDLLMRTEISVENVCSIFIYEQETFNCDRNYQLVCDVGHNSMCLFL